MNALMSVRNCRESSICGKLTLPVNEVCVSAMALLALLFAVKHKV